MHFDAGTASISRQKNFLFVFLVQLGAFWNISARGHALRSQASSLLEAGTCKKRIGEISQMGLGEINADATKE